MKKLTLTTAGTAALLINSIFNPVFSPLFSTAFANDKHNGMMVYHITITNATTNHVITPPIVIAHNKGFHLFKLGNKNYPASDGLATLAETGNPAVLADMLSNDSSVSKIEIADFVTPGVPYTVEIIAPRNAQFSVAGMLATSNDAFTAAINLRAPRPHRYHHAMAKTYDAGSEENNEDCAYIPGPPCAPESGNDNIPGEGIVTVHNPVIGLSNSNL